MSACNDFNSIKVEMPKNDILQPSTPPQHRIFTSELMEYEQEEMCFENLTIL